MIFESGRLEERRKVELNETEPHVGRRIRAIRERRGLSLRAVSERCGLSINAISLIERGENSPTVASLNLLATALDVAITDFFQDEYEQAVVFSQPDTRLRSEADGITMESLGIGLRNQRLEPFLITLAGGAHIDQPITHSGEEFVYCLEGRVEYWVGDRSYLLEQGSSLLFQASRPHKFANVQESPAQLVMVFHAGESSHQARRLHLASMPRESSDGEPGGFGAG